MADPELLSGFVAIIEDTGKGSSPGFASASSVGLHASVVLLRVVA